MDNLIEMRADGDLSKDMFRMKSEELEPKMQKLQKEIEELSQKREPKVIEHYKEKLTILQYALSQYSCPKEGEDVPESVIEAYFSKIVVKKDGFDWYIRINGDPDKPLHCKLEGKRRSTTKVVVTQDFSPALDSSTTGCHQGLRFNPIINPLLKPRGGFLSYWLTILSQHYIVLKRGDFVSEFTYETSDTSRNLETFEWDNVWWEQTANETSKRILYIGDSISCGIRRLITSLSKSEILCDGFGTSKALDNPYFKSSLELFMKQQNKCDAILFNNGLHGWHLSDEEYEKCYDDMLLFLLKAEKPIFIVLTTDDISSQRRNGFVKTRNEVAKALAQKYHLPVIDLHTVAISNSECHVPDGVHFNAMGYELLAKCILESIC
jgi:hypothetical protein